MKASTGTLREVEGNHREEKDASGTEEEEEDKKDEWYPWLQF